MHNRDRDISYLIALPIKFSPLKPSKQGYNNLPYVRNRHKDEL